MLSQKMSLVAIGTLILAGAGIFFWQSQSNNTELPGLSNSNSSSINQNISFSQLMQMGENYTCTFSDSSEESTVTGTAYIAASQNKFRTDYNIDNKEADTQIDNESEMAFDFQNGSVISDGEFVYIWNAETSEGFKMEFDPTDSDFLSDFDMANEDDGGSNNTFDQNQEMEYECEPWNVDDSKFVPPAEIEFQDFSVQFEQIESMMNNIQLESNTSASSESEASFDMSEMCTLCSQLPAGEAQTECLASLGC